MTTVLAVLFVHSLLLVAILWGHGRRAHPANGVLAGLVALIALLLLQAWTNALEAWRRYPHLLGAFVPLWFAVGPLNLVYIRRFIRLPRAAWEPYLAIPSLAVVALLGRFYWGSGSDKLAAVDSPHPTTILTIYLGVSLWTGACAIVAAKTISQHEETDDHEVGAGNVSPSWRRSWLGLLMGALAAYALLDFSATAALAFRGESSALVGNLSLLILVSLVYATGYLVVVPDGLLARAAEAAERVRYGRSPIDTERVNDLASRLERLMCDERPWLDDSLRLDHLAQHLDVTRHQLSQVLNQHLEISFHDYVNAKRVQHAQRLLRDPSWDGNVLTVAMASGFGSSASFYRAFRKHVGGTPKRFVAALDTAS